MELIILGSGTGVIRLERGSPGFLLKTKQSLFLIDSGPGTLTRIVKSGFLLNDIDAIFYTHIHPDHVTDLVPFLFASKYGFPSRKKKLMIVGGRGFKKFFLELSKTYRGWLTPKFPLEVLEVHEHIFRVRKVRVCSSKTNHIFESAAYRFEEDQKSIVFSGDTDFSETLAQWAKGTDVFLLECSFPDSKKVKGHLTPRGVAQMAALSNPGKLILIHFYPPCDKVNVLKEVEKLYKGNVLLGYDGMKTTV
ncbi:MAG: MBL fold metallo-hydrolase [Chlamydiae bacterium]|nr:MBL fold metallo-hydrolase [Chlamydiota bacterium]MBI3277379.1 MBL fold metallo-hydrolase [Chlamydiota bacterium]